MAKLILMFNDQVMQEFPFLTESMTIGRNSESNIQIDNLAVSGHHAKIDKVGSKFILTDLQSTNSTFVNDKKIVSHSLKDRDKIQIGKHVILFLSSETDRAEQSGIDETMLLDTAQQRELLAKQGPAAGQGIKKIGVLSFLGSSEIGEVKLLKVGMQLTQPRTICCAKSECCFLKHLVFRPLAIYGLLFYVDRQFL